MLSYNLLDQVKGANEAILAFMAAGENDYLAGELPPRSVNKELTREKKKNIEEDREIQKNQQDKWDKLNNQSFPASDPVAKY